MDNLSEALRISSGALGSCPTIDKLRPYEREKGEHAQSNVAGKCCLREFREVVDDYHRQLKVHNGLKEALVCTAAGKDAVRDGDVFYVREAVLEKSCKEDDEIVFCKRS